IHTYNNIIHIIQQKFCFLILFSTNSFQFISASYITLSNNPQLKTVKDKEKKGKRKQNVTKPILQGPCAFSWTCCTIWRVERERTRRATEGVPSPLAES
ncbi:LOW QUALITY PROTEIN: hypothetical protein TorRG33x02_148550, partial [Trema orientale]